MSFVFDYCSLPNFDSQKLNLQREEIGKKNVRSAFNFLTLLPIAKHVPGIEYQYNIPSKNKAF